MEKSAMNMKQLRQSINEACGALEGMGIDLEKVPFDINCFDRSEGTNVKCDRVDSIVFDLIKREKVVIEIS